MTHGDTPASLVESEPPHIKNWFSSYEYESFVLETNDNFGFSDPQETQESEGYENECSTGKKMKLTKGSSDLVTDGKYEGMLIKCNQSEEENKCQNQVGFFISYSQINFFFLFCVLESQESPLLSPEPTGIDNWFSSYVYESPEVNTIDDLIVSDHKEIKVGSKEKAKEFKDENLCVTPDDLIPKQTSKCDKGSSKDDNNPTELPNNIANVNSFEKESRKLEEAGDGFVSLKSKKRNDEKSKQVNGVDQKRCVATSVDKMKKKSDERVTLGDVTNILGEHSSVTGKWKCPRKRKPDVGPPLKQLRLGQWFNHV
ncbi:hypothetical protein SSX86_024193 [Deinandra increscens subsp. villosa]|uniref:Uncharacterized protein n=1 Tax=Deinandra increscens subsp. villosa TaxID=3103831 RepID=A0AAP0CP46_9ASTR